MQRGECSFTDKAELAHQNGAKESFYVIFFLINLWRFLSLRYLDDNYETIKRDYSSWTIWEIQIRWWEWIWKVSSVQTLELLPLVILLLLPKLCFSNTKKATFQVNGKNIISAISFTRFISFKNYTIINHYQTIGIESFNLKPWNSQRSKWWIGCTLYVNSNLWQPSKLRKNHCYHYLLIISCPSYN